MKPATNSIAYYLPLAVMACPDHAGKHPFHDQRWIVTADIEIEKDREPDQWRVTNGSLVAQMHDTVPGLAAYMVTATNERAALVASHAELLALVLHGLHGTMPGFEWKAAAKAAIKHAPAIGQPST